MEYLLLAMSDLEAGPFVFVMGMLVIFFGMTIIVLVVSAIGKIMKSTNGKKAKKEASADIAPKETAVSSSDTEDENLRAAIIAAVMAAYYAETGSNCAFKIKKIKKL